MSVPPLASVPSQPGGRPWPEATVVPPPSHRGITFIAWFKLVKGVALVLTGLGAWELRGHDLEDLFQWVVDHAHMAPEGRLVRWVWSRLEDLTDGRLKLMEYVSLGYGAMQLLESYGLFMRRTWAEWLVVVATSVPIPFEVYELIHKPSGMKAGILAFNAALAAYLWYRRADFLTRRQRHQLAEAIHAVEGAGSGRQPGP